MIATTAAKIGRSMKKRENMAACPLYLPTAISTRRASRSLPLPVTSSGGLRWTRSAGMPSAISASRTAAARRFASSTLAAWLPVRSANPGDVDRIGPGLHRGREALEQAERFGVERRLAGREMDGQRRAGWRATPARPRARPASARRASPSPARPGARRSAPSTTTWSPAASPCATNQLRRTSRRRRSAAARPGRPWSTTQTKWPLAPCCTARCGTRIALGRTAPTRRVRTYWFGRSTPFRIVDRRADQERAGLRVVRRIGERDLALVRKHRAVDQLDLDDEAAVLRAA